MAKFIKSETREVPELNTSTLPDLVFTVLFFFMVTTTLRDFTPLVKLSLPNATQVVKLEKKSLVSNIYIGTPVDKRLGSGTVLQLLNDKLSTVDDIAEYITQERNSLSEADQPFMTVSIKADKDTKMLYIIDVKQALRKANALKISYSSMKEKE